MGLFRNKTRDNSDNRFDGKKHSYKASEPISCFFTPIQSQMISVKNNKK